MSDQPKPTVSTAPAAHSAEPATPEAGAAHVQQDAAAPAQAASAVPASDPTSQIPVSDSTESSATASANEAAPAEAPRSRWRGWDLRMPDALESKEGKLKFTIGALGLLLALQWWSARTDISDLRRELAQRLQSGDNLNTQTKLIANRVDDEVKTLQGKVAVLEAKAVESQGQQLALEQLYQDLAKNRDDWALAEIEQVLSTASQQLQLAGNVRGALIALQNADARLTRADRPQFIAVRRAIARDIDSLKNLPSVDLTGIAVRIDTLIAQIDHVPLLADEKPAVVVPLPKTKLATSSASSAKNASPDDDWRSAIQQRWASWSSDLWNEIRQLVRVRSVNSPEALLLSPGEAFFARENLKLRLLNARMALLSRNDAAFRSDLIEADRALLRYFDTRAKQTQAARDLLRQLQDSVLNIEMPTLSHSLAAVRQSRTRP